MRFHADLHVHSKYSRATSRDLDLEHLAHWAARKGIGVVATGDFTHPLWRAELKQKLVPAEPGLFRLRDDIEAAVARTLPPACRVPVRFMLEVEISTIYKKADRTRKIHHLIYAPDFDTADRFSDRLARIGNIASDGRPILGLDSRDLLEITLASGPDAYLVPAHIWTPWFATLGSQSGFDSIAECYGDLADRIFAVETGLSSDPPMNWRVSFLDRYRLTSNSDAHSPGKLGREATTFNCDLDYFAIKRALMTGDGYFGTVEFFPDEGKYHLDGHRKCGVRLSPRETLAHGARCPACGEPVTIGVEHRVEVLADRSEAEAVPPPTAGSVSNLVPLPEVLAELAHTSASSKTVEQSYNRVISTLGPELSILQTVPAEDIGRTDPLLAEAVERLRAGRVFREAGYDGEYGVIRLFEEGELNRRTASGLLFEAPARQNGRTSNTDVSVNGAPAGASPWGARAGAHRSAACDAMGAGSRATGVRPAALAQDGGETLRLDASERSPHLDILSALDEDQRAAAEHISGPLLIIAGPGSGKTRTLTHRIAYLVGERGAAAANCLAITFTRRAAIEMRERVAQLIARDAEQIPIHTFHSFALSILREPAGAAGAGLHRGFRIAGERERLALLVEELGITNAKAERLLRAISKAKREVSDGQRDAVEGLPAYRQAMTARNWIDFDDLIALAARALSTDTTLAASYRERFTSISVDEFQDVDTQQYQFLRLIASAGANICVIGDPDQAIYAFRGADASCFERFKCDYPAAAVVKLARNYRSSGTIVAASAQVIRATDERSAAEIVREFSERITIHTAPTERAEAESVVTSIEWMIGGASFFSFDSGRVNGAAAKGGRNLSFADFAVLYRTEAQSAALREAFERSGIPFKHNSHEMLCERPAVAALLEAITADGRHSLGGQLQAAAKAVETLGIIDKATIAAALHRIDTLAQTCADRAQLLDAVALASDIDFFDPGVDRVSLLTLHAAKGLEFPAVFIVGLEDGLIPLHWGAPEEAAIAEERRLFYVGMTRAKDLLILSRAEKRLWNGRLRMLEPSPFLHDIEKELLAAERSQLPRGKAGDRQLTLF
jgi:ATP-dependent DNA helicase UvrD/PcrA